ERAVAHHVALPRRGAPMQIPVRVYEGGDLLACVATCVARRDLRDDLADLKLVLREKLEVEVLVGVPLHGDEEGLHSDLEVLDPGDHVHRRANGGGKRVGGRLSPGEWVRSTHAGMSSGSAAVPWTVSPLPSAAVRSFTSLR